jgi:hypothetical protein
MSGRFGLLAHDILNVFSQARVVAMAEYSIVPTSFNSKTVELNIVLDNSLVFTHLQIIDSIFSISNGVNRSEVRAE